MKLYRGVTNILISKVNPLHVNKSDDWHLTYGSGTSYSFEENLALNYAKFSTISKNVEFGLFLTYEFNDKNMFSLHEKHFIDEDDNEAGFFIDGDSIETKNLASYLSKKGYDSVMFDLSTEGFEHVMLLDNSSVDQLQLVEVIVQSENKKVHEILKENKFIQNENGFIIPLDRIHDADALLESFIV